MAARVALQTEGRIEIEDLVAVLCDHGAEAVQVDRRTGDTPQGVTGFFFINFNDTQALKAETRQRHAFGFHANPSSEHEDGWTRVEIGADGRGRALVEAIAIQFGGTLIDESENTRTQFERAPSLSMVA